jgi:hypothetical protein
VASQDFQVKTISPQAGGAIRDCYKTCFYVGGDATTAKVLLDYPVPPEIETILGSGPVMLRCKLVKRGALAQTPFTDNQSLYFLLGDSTYVPDEEPVVDEVPEIYEQAHEEFRMVDVLPRDEDVLDVPVAPAPTIVPKAPDKSKRPKATDIDINILCMCWNGGANTVLALEQLFNFSHGEAYKAYKMILAQMGQSEKEEAEEQE